MKAPSRGRESFAERIRRAGERFGPSLALGLFCGRILGEQWIAGSTIAPAGLRPEIAFLLTVLTTLASVLLLRRAGLSRLWPLLFLLIYVFYPEPAPTVAFSSALLAFFAMLQVLFRRRGSLDQGGFLAFVPLLFVVVLFSCIYGLTMARDVLPADNGEFQLIGSSLGVAHPPGFPLYTMLAHLLTLLPLGATAAFRVNLLSIVTSVLALLFTCLSVLQVTGGEGERRPLIAVTVAIVLGTSTTFWAQATTANIRSMTALFAAMAIYLLLRFRAAVQGRSAEKPGPESRRRRTTPQGTITSSVQRTLILFALVMGFGITHHASLAFMAIVFIIFLLVTDPDLARSPRRWFRPLVGSALGLLPLLYLLWRGWAQANGDQVLGAPADLATLDGFLNHALASGFRGDLFYFLDPPILWERLKVMANVMTFQFSPLILWGMGLSLVIMVWRDRRLALLLAGSFAIHTLVTATYRAPQTVEYMLPAYIPAVIILGYGVAWVDRAMARSQNRNLAAAAPALASIIMIGAVNQATGAFSSYRLQHDYSPTREYVSSLLEHAPPAAVILADWHWATPLWYLQQVEGKRADVSIEYVFPTDEPYATTWSRRIGEELVKGRDVLATHFDEQAYAELPPAEPIGDAYLYRQEPLRSLPAGFVPLELILGEAIHVVGLKTDDERVQVGQEATLTIAWESVADLPSNTSLFAHLVGEDGNVYAQDDLLARSQSEGLTLTQFRLTPRFGTLPGKVEIMFGAYNDTPLSDAEGRQRTPVASLTVDPMAHPAVTNHPLNRIMVGAGSGRRLVGYDWDETLPDTRRLYLHWLVDDGYTLETRDGAEAGALSLGQYLGPWGVNSDRWSLSGQTDGHYVPFGQGIVWTGTLLDESVHLRPGETIWLRQTFQSSQPVISDIATSVRLVGYEPDGVHWAWWDLDDEYGIPAMGAIPTLKWIAGSTVHDPHRLSIPDDAVPGQTAGVILRLYETFSGRSVPVLDERFAQATPWRLTAIAREE